MSAELLERMLHERDKCGVDSAADWVQRKGIPRELAILALVGLHKAASYGVGPGTWIGWRERRDGEDGRGVPAAALY